MTEYLGIWAQDRKGVIGNDGRLPWPRLKTDMDAFQEVTARRPVIMGRKTWESLPLSSQPLKNRMNVVLSSDPFYVADGAVVVPNIETAMNMTKAFDGAFVIGGGEILRKFMPFLAGLVVTHVDLDAEGDTYAPEIGPEWAVDQQYSETDPSGVDLVFKIYAR